MKKLLCIAILLTNLAWADTAINFMPLASHEIQPQLLTDSAGTAHLIFFKIEDPHQDHLQPDSGSLYYRAMAPNADTWGASVKISSNAFARPDVISAARFAVDDNHRVHVTWFQSDTQQYFYTRSNLDATQFENPRPIVKDFLDGVEAGSNIAVHGSDVTITWAAGSIDKEYQRSVYSLRSTDGGEHFGSEMLLGDQSLGACACCGFASRFIGDNLFVAYRTAVENKGRHMQLLRTENNKRADTRLIHPWEINACPVSTNNFSDNTDSDTWLVFETEGDIYQYNVSQNTKPQRVNGLFQFIRQKHPDIAINGKGERLIVWGEGRGYSSGGNLKLRLFDVDNRELTSLKMDNKVIAKFSAAAVTALADNSFLVVY